MSLRGDMSSNSICTVISVKHSSAEPPDGLHNAQIMVERAFLSISLSQQDSTFFEQNLSSQSG